MENSSGTLIFMDLESTGLPSEIGPENVRITEIGMIATTIYDFESCIQQPRLLNKLNLLIQPPTRISPVASQMTGLDNLSLENQFKFSVESSNVIFSFLKHLQKPWIMISHNGRKFDFPLLKAELQNLNLELPVELELVDTCEAFKSIFDSSSKMASASQLQIEPRVELSNSPEPKPKSLKTTPDSPTKRYGSSSDSYNVNRVKRRLLDSEGNKICLKLQQLYVKCYGTKASFSHTSEGDCLTLLMVCLKYRKELLDYLVDNKIKVDSIKPLW